MTFRMKAAPEIKQMAPAGIILPDLDHLKYMIPANASEVPNCTNGFGGFCEFKWAP